MNLVLMDAECPQLSLAIKPHWMPNTFQHLAGLCSVFVSFLFPSSFQGVSYLMSEVWKVPVEDIKDQNTV